MSDDDPAKIFDVQRGQAPPHTAKPIIVGHHPTMPDPMIHHDLSGHPQTPVPEPSSTPVQINVTEAHEQNTPPASQGAGVGNPLTPIVPTPAPPAEPDLLKATEPPAQPTIEDLKVKLPAGEAAHKTGKAIWALLFVVAVAVGLFVAYLVKK